MSYGWLITRDLLAEEDGFPSSLTEPCPGNETGVYGPHGISDALVKRLFAGEGDEFRMLDDDEIPYYEGRIIVPEPSVTIGEDIDPDFAPLDDFGTPNAGCVTIQYKSANGEWETI